MGPSATAKLTLHAIPAPRRLSWRSPRSLLLTTLRNQLLPVRHKRFMGHVFVELEDAQGRVMTGMTSAHSFDVTDGGLVRGWRRARALLAKGLGLLFETHAGRLDEQAAAERELDDHYASGRVRFAAFELAPATARRLRTYLEEYRARGLDRKYGAAMRPLHGEGAGCATFGVSFLEVAGLLDDELREALLQRVAVPCALMGSTERPVSPLELVLGERAGRWARGDEPQQTLEVFDPTLLADWIDAVLAGEASGRLGARAERRGAARGIVLDARAAAAPSGPIWRVAAAS